MTVLPDTVRLQRERIAILAIFVGAITIAFAPILVRLSELGPMATGFHRFLLAIPLYWLIAATLPRQDRGRRREAENPARFPADGMAGFISRPISWWHYSIQMTTVANSTLLANVAPVFVVLGGWLLFRTRSPRYLMGYAAMTKPFLAGQPVPKRGSFLRRPTGRANRRV